jgi:hypothetical protein
MRPWQILLAKPMSEGLMCAMLMFSFSWPMATLLSIFVWAVGGLEHPIALCFSTIWAITSTFVFAVFTPTLAFLTFKNLTRLADHVRQLEESGAASRQPS